MKLEKCPCCLGEAELARMMVGDTEMWQVTCSSCGLSTELDDDQTFSAERWNLRLERSKLKMWVTLLASLLPFLVVTAFLGGSFMGLRL
ncbi:MULTISPECIES: Lar family restriction alleviation protein [unclassified Endozoicomonas]|uniref:Lar family restriction alleviation protein n=1 Tax=unclassified Endozoicomonas TaxID=2644528 RepID=UPI0021474422|nr:MULTISPECIES: Lar family restriction alleviation protein [unclassified Endozoicomonas]